MPLLTIMKHDVWRKALTEYYQAEANLIELVPVETYKSEEVDYFLTKTLAVTPEPIAPGSGFPISMGTYEKGTVTLDLYGIGIEVPKHDIDFRKFNVLRKELELKGRGMSLYQDRKISDALHAVTENTFASTGWSTFSNAVGDIAKAIRYIDEDNIPGGATHLVCDPESQELLLKGMTVTAEAIAAPGVIREGRVTRFLGLDVKVNNNLQYGTEAYVVAKNRFGWMPQAYSLSTLGPKLIDQLFVYRAFVYAMDGFVLDQPKATCRITAVHA